MNAASGDSPPRPNGVRLFLVGMMGSGKTTVGRLVASRLGWRHLDSDEEILRRTGKSVPEIFAQDGESAFRAEEALVLADAAREHEVVVSVAGGAVLAEPNRAVLARAGRVIWLRASAGTLERRVGDGRGRPLLGTDPAKALRSLEERRRPLYEMVADGVVDVDSRTPEEVCDDVLVLWLEPSSPGQPHAVPDEPEAQAVFGDGELP